MVPPAGKGPGAIWKVLATWSLDISYGSPTFLHPGHIRLWKPDFTTFTASHVPYCLFLRIFPFSFYLLKKKIFFFCPYLHFVFQFLFTNSHPQGWAHRSFWIFLLITHHPENHQHNGSKGPSSLFKLFRVRPLEDGFLSATLLPQNWSSILPHCGKVGKVWAGGSLLPFMPQGVSLSQTPFLLFHFLVQYFSLSPVSFSLPHPPLIILKDVVYN